MGAQESKGSKEDFSLSNDEKISLQSSFDAVISDSSRECVKNELLDQWSAKIDVELAAWLCDYLFTKNPGGVTFTSYVYFYNKFVKGSLSDQIEIINSFFSPQKEDLTVNTTDMLKYVEKIISSYIKCHGKHPKFLSWHAMLSTTTDDHLKNIAQAWLRELLYGTASSGKDTFSLTEPIGETVSFDDVEKWLNRSAEVLYMQKDLLLHLFRPEESIFCKTGFLMPSCVSVPGHLQFESLLDATNVILLNSALPPEYRQEWHFLFSTSIHGESFSKMLGCITNKGPTLIIVSDTLGNVFGGFAPVCWDLGAKFYGDDRSFLFSLNPKMGIYRSTGYNDHFMYLNVQQQTLPNGLGMGGQFGYFGFWLDAEFGSGHCSKSCTTFDCPQLSNETEFKVHNVEVWAVGKPPPTPQELGERPSVLEGNYEAKALLSMAGREEHSLGYREKEDLDL
ncbi:MTOR-associated protein MEAK7 [Ischnura elegans]|uniref:MTOR-associated protein MEAK7 n=1 Tax=Ischnura elegans TaxID=197161 RepID=UPI001ED87FFF|nr:MTOR-associated protein MEAK7 [Ischnura elegans]